MAVPPLLLMLLFAAAFTFMKASILVINPDTVDVALARIDRAIHGGVDPWRLLQPVLGFPVVTWFIDGLYQYWLVLVVCIWLWQAFSLRDPCLRQQFFVSFTLCWIVLGTVVAHLLPSAGPCFYGRVTGFPDDFAPLMDYLRSARQTHAVLATGYQDFLWGVYASNRLTIGAGISAMPSMHVSFAFLFALVGWKTDRRLGMALAAYAAVILLGSVHLGWHYAIDGYFSIAATALVWWGVGWMQRHSSRRRGAAESTGSAASGTTD